MVNFFDVLKGIVEGMIPGEQTITYLEMVYFFLVFLLLFSISFTGTAYVPMFKDKKEYNNIRMVIALSMAFLTTITFFELIVAQLQFFGLIAAIAFGISVVVLGVIPADKRQTMSSKIVGLGIIAALLMVITFSYGTGWIETLIGWVSGAWTGFLSSGTMGIILIVLVMAAGVIAAIVRGAKKGP